jgi:hypothetical protein
VNASALKFELVLFAALLCTGVVLLPLAVYWVGQFVVGEYESDGGVGGLLGALWDDLGQGSIPAWILVASPYVVIQLFRLARALLRRPVKDVTVSAGNR